MTPTCPACAATIPEGAGACPACGAAATAAEGSSGGPPPDLPPRYRVVRFLGRGAMGRVFLCRDLALDLEVAVKVLPADLASDPAAVEQVRDEARISARLRDGPGILPLHAFESHGSTWFLVEEFAPGGTLQERIRERGPLPEDEARRVGAEVAEALAFAHGRRVLHRDVKPSNILLDAAGRPRLADFGLAKALADASSRRSGSSVAGTPTYMAPETMWDGRTDERSDLYALGCVLYECATGTRPFDGVYHEIARAKTPGAAAPDPRAKTPSLSEPFAGIVRGLLDPDPSRRPASAAEAAAALREGAAPGPPRPAHAPARAGARTPIVVAGSSRFSQRIRPLRRPLGAVGALVIVACLAALGVALAKRGPSPGIAPTEPDGAPAAPATEAFLEVADLGPGAEVFVDGKRLDAVDGKVPVPSGTRSVVLVRDGFEPESLPTRAYASRETVRIAAPAWRRAKAIADAPPPPRAPDLPANLPAALREEGSRWFHEKDGAEMVFVPEGEFLMGQDGGHPANAPAHRVTLSAVFVDRHEVTNAQFARFVRATGFRTDAEKIGAAPVLFGGDWREVRGADWRHPLGPDSSVEGRDREPVVQVSWNDARAYARWAGKRLPTEAEFERWLRRGVEGARFPWGDAEEPPAEFANLADRTLVAVPEHDAERVVSKEYDDGFPGTAPVGSFPADPFGLFDICGNVWEWCEDALDVEFYSRSPARDPCNRAPGGLRLFRGGGFLGLELECTYRNRGRQSGANPTIGFRCVLDIEAR